MTSDMIGRLQQLAGIVRLTNTVDIGRASSITRLPEGVFRKAFAAIRADNSFKGQFVSPTLYSVQQNIEAFIKAFTTQVISQSGQATSTVASMPASAVVKPTNLLPRMEKMFKASRRIKIDDACAVLGMDRTEMIGWIIDESEKLGVKVDGDYLVAGEGMDTGVWLDEQFSAWDKREREKEGKIE